MNNKESAGKDEKAFEHYVNSEGVFYHASLAPGVKFDEKVVDEVREAVHRNLELMTKEGREKCRVKLRDIF